jgi:hypothetical protein
MTAKIMGSITFADDHDADGAEIALRRAGYHVIRMPEKFRPLLCHPDDYFMEASIDGSDDDKIVGAIMDEINAIVDQYGGHCDEVQSITPDHVPFEALFELRPGLH